MIPKPIIKNEAYEISLDLDDKEFPLVIINQDNEAVTFLTPESTLELVEDLQRAVKRCQKRTARKKS